LDKGIYLILSILNKYKINNFEKNLRWQIQDVGCPGNRPFCFSVIKSLDKRLAVQKGRLSSHFRKMTCYPANGQFHQHFTYKFFVQIFPTNVVLAAFSMYM